MSFLIKELGSNPSLSDKYTIQRFKKGEVLFSAQDKLNSIMIIKKGKLKTYSLSENGTKHLMRIYEEGGLLGDVEIFTDRLVICFVEAMDEGEMYVIKGDSFLKWMESDFNLSLYMVRQLAEKLINTGIKMQSAVRHPLKYQVLLFIWKYHKQYNKSCIPKELIVEELGSNIRSINRVLKQLAEEEILINLKGKVKVQNLDLILSMISSYDL